MFTKNRIEKKIPSVCGKIRIAATAAAGAAAIVLWLKALTDPERRYTKRYRVRKGARRA
jgi:hypothetical protein